MHSTINVVFQKPQKEGRNDMERENNNPTPEEIEAEEIFWQEMADLDWEMEKAEHEMWRTATSENIKNGIKPLISL